jgi:acyl CoA:acetate/3-ketoacid CoA transferase
VVLAEIAPGVDVRQDVLDRMGFEPLIPRELEIMPAHYFVA